MSVVPITTVDYRSDIALPSQPGVPALVLDATGDLNLLNLDSGGDLLVSDLSTADAVNQALGLLDMIADRLGILSAVREGSGSLRVSSVGGSVMVSSVGGTVTVGGSVIVSNQGQQGGLPTNQIVPATQNLAARMNTDQLIVS